MSNDAKMTEQQINEVVLAATKALLDGKELSDVIEVSHPLSQAWKPTANTEINSVINDIKREFNYRVKPKLQ